MCLRLHLRMLQYWTCWHRRVSSAIYTSDDELVRFVWKRNKQYDIMLLSAVESKNPFAFKCAKSVWKEIAKELQDSSLQMKVSDRSCRARVVELLKVYRRDERYSKAASGVAEPETTQVDTLLTNIAKLQDGGPDKEVRNVYATTDKSMAEAIRAAAIAEVIASNNEDDNSRHSLTDLTNDSMPPETNVSEAAQAAYTSVDTTSLPDQSDIETSSVDDCILVQASTDSSTDNASVTKKSTSSIEHNPAVSMFFTNNNDEEEEGDISEKLKTQSSSSKRSNAKHDMVRYLENKSERDFEIRKDEIQVRREEVKIQAKEAENKSKELDILREKAKADGENQLKMMDLLMKLIDRQ